MPALVISVANWPGSAAALATLIPWMTAVVIAKITAPATAPIDAATSEAAIPGVYRHDSPCLIELESSGERQDRVRERRCWRRPRPSPN